MSAPQEVRLPWPSNYVGSLLYAFGKELQVILGEPTVVVREDFGLEDTELKLTSTFGLPSAGTLVGSGFVLKYTEKFEASVTVPLLPTEPRHAVLSLGSELRLKTSDILPPNYQADIAALEATPPDPIIEEIVGP